MPILYDGDPDWYGNLVSQDDGSFLRTNIPLHLEFTRKRKRKQETHYAQVIRLAKFWVRNVKQRAGGLPVQVVHGRAGDGEAARRWCKFFGLPRSFANFFTYIARSNFRERIAFSDYYGLASVGTFTEPVKIIDPVNAKNNVSRPYTTAQADAVVNAALDAGDAIDAALAAPTKGDSVRYWQKVFGPSFQA